mmetsp:Transcript_27392/g.78842  ORF Transcript_27392/g.78842 Transcript_27392/m.78842 type:complete len:241 (+) Transcript_27392:903-1625(+)
MLVALGELEVHRHRHFLHTHIHTHTHTWVPWIDHSSGRVVGGVVCAFLRGFASGTDMSMRDWVPMFFLSARPMFFVLGPYILLNDAGTLTPTAFQPPLPPSTRAKAVMGLLVSSPGLPLSCWSMHLTLNSSPVGAAVVVFVGGVTHVAWTGQVLSNGTGSSPVAKLTSKLMKYVTSAVTGSSTMGDSSHLSCSSCVLMSPSRRIPRSPRRQKEGRPSRWSPPRPTTPDRPGAPRQKSGTR